MITDTQAKLEQCDRDIRALQEEHDRLKAQLEEEEERRPKVRHGDVIVCAGSATRIVIHRAGGYYTAAPSVAGYGGVRSKDDIECLINSGDYQIIGNIFDLSVEELRECFAKHKEG